jgi:PAS domain S-box-containing protein
MQPIQESGSVQQGGDYVRQFRAIAELSGDVAWIIDCATGLPAYISPGIENLLGYPMAEFHAQLANPASGGPLAGLCAGLQERLRRFAAGDRSRTRVVRQFDQKRPDGSVVAIELISTVLVGENGGPDSVVGVLRDISAQRNHDAEQRRFASMLNHEFRTPLSTIDGAIQRLEAKSAHADDATRQRYRNIAIAVDRLIGMLDDYLSPDRLEAIGRTRHPDSMSPRQLLEEGAVLAREGGRHATVEAADLPADLRCAPDGLRLAIKVLVENAVRFSPADSPVVLLGRRGDNGIELLVRDAGPGVPEDEQDRIFDKFFRGRNAAELPGSGLGLYMARSVIDVHGGSVSMRNLDNCGAEFKIWLPAQGGVGKLVASDTMSGDNPAKEVLGGGLQG